MKWYERNVSIVLLLIFFFPVGLFLMWKYANWKPIAKMIVTALIAIGCIGVILNPAPAATTATPPTANSTPSIGNDLPSSNTSSDSENVQLSEDTIKQELKDSIQYYKDVVTTELPNIAKDEDTELIIPKMEDAIKRLDSDTDKYLAYMSDKNLSEDVRKACENVKTAFYGVSSTVLKPTLAIFKGESSEEAPDYGTIVIDAETQYLDSAMKLIK